MFYLGFCCLTIPILVLIVKLAVIWPKVKDRDLPNGGHVTAAGSNPFPHIFTCQTWQLLGPAVSLHFGCCHPSLRISVIAVSSLLAFGIMANTSTKTKKTRGAANAVTPMKRTRRAGNNKKAPVN